MSMKGRIRLPFLVWVVLVSTFVACAGGTSFLGYNITGIAWLVPLCFSLLGLVAGRGAIRFPMGVWLPWIALVVIYLSVAEAPNALQRSIMILCPIVVGMSVSRLHIGETGLKEFDRALRLMAMALWVVVVLKTGIYLTGRLPEITGLAAEVMTASLLAAYFVAGHVLSRRLDLAWWAGLAAIPLVAMTRTGIAVAGLTYPATFAPLKAPRRIVLFALIVTIALALFDTERVQQKMFYSGQGTLQDVRLDNRNFRMTGRNTMWEAMAPEIDQKPLLGHGANASEPFVSWLTGGIVHPHNDWLRLLYDYGYLGTMVFAWCVFMQVLHALKSARKSAGTTRVLFYAGASSFLSFILFMFTDNIILYAAFFGNLQFAILGVAYAAHADDMLKNGKPRYGRLVPASPASDIISLAEKP